MDFSIVVVANRKRKAIILDYLKGIEHLVYYSEDPDLPNKWKADPTYKGLVVHMHQHIGQWRCLEAHKKAIELADEENILILEDDARVDNPNWLIIADYACSLLNRFEIISIHSREPNYPVWKKEKKEGLILYYPKDNKTPRRALGTLAYVTSKSMLPRIQEHFYNGLPIDIFYANCFNFAFLEPTPLIHDRSSGSLIDIGVNK